MVALRNGAMGWELAGLRCERGRTERFTVGVPKSLKLALERASAFADASGVRVIDAAQLAAFEADPSRSLYVLDVRDPPEFRAEHRAGSVNAPGGQSPCRRPTGGSACAARCIVLLDDTGARGAHILAAWLRLMGHRDVFVVTGGLSAVRAGGRPTPRIPELAGAPLIDVPGLMRLLDAGDDTVVVDVARSVDYRDGHIPGALWGIRTRLAALAPRLAEARHVVATSLGGRLARLAIAELRGLTSADVTALDGGTELWRAHGRPVVKDRTSPPDEEAAIDCYLRPYDRNAGIEEAMNAYLSWEIDLVNEITRDGTVRFGAASANDDEPAHAA